MEEQMRLNKYIARCGVCSRKDADKLIEQGRVEVDGKPAQIGQVVYGGESVRVDGKPLKGEQEKKVFACYKPLGVVCTERDAHVKRTILDVVKTPVRVTYAGRLDKDSEGLLLLSNDGNLIEAMMRGSNGHEKEYEVKVNKIITGAFLKKMSGGVYLEDLDRTTRPCRVEKLDAYTFRIILTQGWNRQIRRMCRACGYEVQGLQRVRVVNVLLGDMRPGEYRELTGEELQILYQKIGLKE